MRQVLLALGLTPTGANYKTVYQTVSRLSLSTDHFLGQGHLKGGTHNWATRIPLREICVENSSYTNVAYLKHRLLAEGLAKKGCYICGLTAWLGKPISLVLDHINGINNDHRLENLRLLCPNCNAQQDTFAGKNKRKNTLRAAAQTNNH